ncbi:hypothetical protein LEP1GSC202_0348 [Leptospira yanagawae serovar Saopaulo str. Sao Paulo = ATCC 700523]|uniref:Uncharacterized protein n=2 Tax=Leptospira yanagawae TaxID=293069 RepID=A0A5E8HGD2_9LEPT|nr:hypothetical protein LEP1GSC202_0348 [Leptospira yanagawae serovar Saopaulo str. Sao Paulo = ATCC 700523]
MGLILESMLFYRKTIVLCNSWISLKQLFNTFGIDNINKLIDSETLEILFSESLSGISTNKNQAGIELHNLVIVSSPQHTLDINLKKICTEITGREGRGRRIANSFEGKIKKFNFDAGFVTNAKSIFSDEGYINKSVQLLLKNWIPELENEKIENFKVEQVENGFIVNSKLDFNSLNKIYNKSRINKENILTPAYLLTNIFDVETDLFHASNNLSEIVSTTQKSMLIEVRLKYLTDKYLKSAEKKENFIKYISPSFNTIRDEFNQGKIDINSIIESILHSNKFKKWLENIDNNEDLLQEYLKEISKDNLINKMPNKIYRWGFFTLGGLFLEASFPTGIGTISGVALSFLDSFLFEKLAIGWQPNQFVNQYLIKNLKD